MTDTRRREMHCTPECRISIVICYTQLEKLICTNEENDSQAGQVDFFFLLMTKIENKTANGRVFGDSGLELANTVRDGVKKRKDNKQWENWHLDQEREREKKRKRVFRALDRLANSKFPVRPIHLDSYEWVSCEFHRRQRWARKMARPGTTREICNIKVESTLVIRRQTYFSGYMFKPLSR